MKNVTIKITGKRFVGDNVEEELEFVSDGMMFEKGGAKYFIYEEIGDSSEYGSVLEFETGKRFKSDYSTPYGPMSLEVLTNSIKRELSPEGYGKITLEYDISLRGMIEGRNELAIEIMQ